MTKPILIVSTAVQLLVMGSALGACEVVEGGKKAPFDGASLAGRDVEKKSLVALNKAFPGLNVVEKAFKGEIQTCSSCSDKYITCSE